MLSLLNQTFTVAYTSATRINRFLLALGLVLLAATLFPCDSLTAVLFRNFGLFAISAFLFLQGARLSREAMVGGVMHWRLHGFIATSTFILFPVLGLCAWSLTPNALPNVFWLGILFICVLPSTVQSYIALTSIAIGNVAGMVCSDTISNVVGTMLTPLLFSLIAHTRAKGGVDLTAISWVLMELLAPFAVFATMLFCIVILLTVVLAFLAQGGRAIRLGRENIVAALFCGCQKSLVSAVPIANVLFPQQLVGPMLLPTMIYYPLQLVVCGVLARRLVAIPLMPANEAACPLASDSPVKLANGATHAQ